MHYDYKPLSQRVSASQDTTLIKTNALVDEKLIWQENILVEGGEKQECR
jgi:hypothetical protein